MQAGRPALIQKDGGEMLIAIDLDRPLAEAKALADDPAAFTREKTRILCRIPCVRVDLAVWIVRLLTKMLPSIASQCQLLN